MPAESDRCEIVEDNYYFPPKAVHREYIEESQTYTWCPWKGKASYYDVVVDGQRTKTPPGITPIPSPPPDGSRIMSRFGGV